MVPVVAVVAVVGVVAVVPVVVQLAGHLTVNEPTRDMFLRRKYLNNIFVGINRTL